MAGRRLGTRWSARGRAPRARAVLAASVVAALAVACTSEPPDATPIEGTTPPATVARAAWKVEDAPPHSNLSVTKDSVVYAEVVDEQLFVIALDPTTGDRRWRKPADVGYRVPGVEYTVVTDDDTAYFLDLRPSRSATTSVLLAVDARSGDVRWRAPLGGLADATMARCGETICVEVYGEDQAEGDQAELLRVARADGAVVAEGVAPSDAVLAATDGDAGPVTSVLAGRDPVLLTQTSDHGARTDWTVPAKDVFGGDVSPDGGWNGDLIGDDTWVLHLGPPTDIGEPAVGTALAPGGVAAVDRRGTPRWHRFGRKPCDPYGAVTVVCDGSSVWDGERAVWTPSVMEGLDAVTGSPRWTLRLDGQLDILGDGTQLLRLDADRFVVPLPGGAVVVHDDTGPQGPPPAGTAGWCRTDRGEDTIANANLDDRAFTRAEAAFPCGLDGKALDAPPSLPVPGFAGVRVAGFSVWVDRDGAIRGTPEG